MGKVGAEFAPSPRMTRAPSAEMQMPLGQFRWHSATPTLYAFRLRIDPAPNFYNYLPRKSTPSFTIGPVGRQFPNLRAKNFCLICNSCGDTRLEKLQTYQTNFDIGNHIHSSSVTLSEANILIRNLQWQSCEPDTFPKMHINRQNSPGKIS